MSDRDEQGRYEPDDDERHPTRAQLISALQPFADYGLVYGDRYNPDSPSVWDRVPDDKVALRGTHDQHCITVGELRAAARLYYANGGNPIT